ncbi:Heme chaperone HemW [Camellia lanceoleosa]|uniref:Heme chaperone HemW n=1 Tax=Camellia lanceoleosa TaxID=1840588 RepID=A0ACC0HXY0_9ERIC|nr:Heme chaperone HemW [Camellia lanceoleosa]
MLRSTFTPLLHTIPSKPKPPNLFSHSISISLSESPPTVRQNASPTTAATTTTNPLHNLSPTSAYIHLPFCRKRCHYCDFPIVALGSSSTQTNDINNDPRISNYIHLLCREIKATNSQFNHNPPLKTVFFGGGTPSLVPPRLVSLVLETLNLKFGLCLDAEISMEMDLGTFDVVKMKELMGMDLISSLPHQTPQMWEESLLLTVNARPKHVSVYDLQVERGTKFGILYSPGEFPLPSETQSAEFYKTASRMLSDAGYNHYEISSYCKDNFECKHNLTYWDNKSFYGFGLGSTSFLGGFRF